MPCSMTRQTSFKALIAKERVSAAEVSHRCTTLFTDLTLLSALELASALTQASESRKQLIRKETDPDRPTP